MVAGLDVSEEAKEQIHLTKIRTPDFPVIYTEAPQLRQETDPHALSRCVQ